MPLPHSKGGRCPPFESLSPRRQLQTRFAFALSTNETQSKSKPRLQFLCKSKRKQTAFALPSGKANQLQTESKPIAKQLQSKSKAVQGFLCFSFAFHLLFEFLQNPAINSLRASPSPSRKKAEPPRPPGRLLAASAASPLVCGSYLGACRPGWPLEAWRPRET